MSNVTQAQGEYLLPWGEALGVLACGLSGGSSSECFVEVREAVERHGGRIDTYRLPLRFSWRSVVAFFSKERGVLMSSAEVTKKLSDLDVPFFPLALALPWNAGELHCLEMPESLTLRTGLYSFATLSTQSSGRHESFVEQLVQWTSGLSSLDRIVRLELEGQISDRVSTTITVQLAKALGLEIQNKTLDLGGPAYPVFLPRNTRRRSVLRRSGLSLPKITPRGFGNVAAPLFVAFLGLTLNWLAAFEGRSEALVLQKSAIVPTAIFMNGESFWPLVERAASEGPEESSRTLESLSIVRKVPSQPTPDSGGVFVVSFVTSVHGPLQPEDGVRKEVVLKFDPPKTPPPTLEEWGEDRLQDLMRRHAVALYLDRQRAQALVRGDTQPVDRVVALLADPAFMQWPWRSIVLTRVGDGLVRVEIRLG